MFTWDGWYSEDDKFDEPEYLEWESILVRGSFTQQIQLNFPVLKYEYIKVHPISIFILNFFKYF